MRNRYLQKGRTILLGVALLGGCRGVADSPVSIPSSLTAPAPDLDAPNIRTLDDEFVDLAHRAPGFGGMFFDSEGRLNVYLTNPTFVARSAGPIRDFLTKGRLPGTTDPTSLVSNMRVLSARYDFSQLAGWHARVTAIAADRAVTQTDIDETRNRVVIGVVDSDGARRVRHEVGLLEIPEGAVEIEVIPPSNTIADLRGTVRPVPSSVQIGTSTSFCTLGWNAYRQEAGQFDGQRYFFTCSHCTSEFGAVDGVTFGQPTIASPIGVEVLDPPMFTNAQYSDCPPGDRCRWSDAAVVRYNTDIVWNHGRIPTVGGSAPFVITGYRDIGGGASEYDLIVGRTAYKTGRTTGTTSGRIVSSCVRTRQWQGGVPTDRVLLCQMQADQLGVGGGDSGSPVYLTDVPGGLHLVGILWGTADTLGAPASPVRTTFSRWYQASLEMRETDGARWVEIRAGACPWCGY